MEETLNYFVKEKIKMENYENKELLKEAAKQSLAKLKDLDGGKARRSSTTRRRLRRRGTLSGQSSD